MSAASAINIDEVDDDADDDQVTSDAACSASISTVARPVRAARAKHQQVSYDILSSKYRLSIMCYVVYQIANNNCFQFTLSLIADDVA
jgi:hypothetical protein